MRYGLVLVDAKLSSFLFPVHIDISFGLVASEGKWKQKRWNQLYLFAFMALLARREECCCSLRFGEDLHELAWGLHRRYTSFLSIPLVFLLDFLVVWTQKGHWDPVRYSLSLPCTDHEDELQ